MDVPLQVYGRVHRRSGRRSSPPGRAGSPRRPFMIASVMRP
ncbi:hypothetical protein Ae406Ps2_4561c [Pseudonocardia sp. Ae406_Ps2]|nr:hypothetical protein Ae406Ps2_4561c [Pseudonocardia sp. Ae406_Ps2]OLM26130.1 hypothetical protein Ae706Ps2_4563c [Pseudonocardia sp. Ae706_Ps2]